jgi:hypothetical protein
VPEGAVPLRCISAGGVPEGAAFSEVPADACPDVSGVPAAEPETAAGVAVLPVSDVQPATKIPEMRIADATSMIMMLLFMGYVSLTIRGSHSHSRLMSPAGGSSVITVTTPPFIFTSCRE